MTSEAVSSLLDIVKDTYQKIGDLINISEDEKGTIKRIGEMGEGKLDEVTSSIVGNMLKNERLVSRLKDLGIESGELHSVVKDTLDLVLTFSEGDEGSLRVAQISSFVLTKELPLGDYLTILGYIYDELISSLDIQVGNEIRALSKAFVWFSSVAAESYHQAVLTSIKRSSGLSDQLIDRAIKISSGKVHEELEEEAD